MTIDLRSDTVTRPSAGMLDFMMNAKVGDMVMDEDPSVNELEARIAELFSAEAALFCPSGTMSNQIAIKLHTSPGDDVICSKLAHIYQYEGGGIAFNSGASVTLIDSPDGLFTAEDVLNSIQPDDPHKPRTSCVTIENTVNRGGGRVWNHEEVVGISKVCRSNGLAFHLDGARIFNALARTKVNPAILGGLFDTISVCLSKGLGAPVGTMLMGSSDNIKTGKRIRKVLGGTMRQAGYLAAAGIWALENNIERLEEDHYNASRVAEAMKKTDWVISIKPVDTNIIAATVSEKINSAAVAGFLKQKGLLCLPVTNDSVRLVTHLDATGELIERAIGIISSTDLEMIENSLKKPKVSQ
ncbi:MAG TPA: GntG family PLP-dependent aldolase [Bacteroidales bacterium]|nr:GntG family PLP-dependent aldolase [Bacteroidales bacterium]